MWRGEFWRLCGTVLSARSQTGDSSSDCFSVSGEENVNDAGGVCLRLCTATYTSRSNFSKAEFLQRCTSATAMAVVAVVEVPLVVRTPLFFKVLLSLPLELRRSSVV